MKKLFVCLFALSPLYASEVDPFNLSLEEILNMKVEVATLVKDDERDIPAAVSVITEKEWRRYGAQRGAQAIDRLTGMTTSPFLGSYIAGLRGFNSTSNFRKMSYVIDGVPLNTFFNGSAQFGAGNFLDLYLLERIEVARGPISNVYGSSAMLGAISMKTWDPDKNTIESSLSVGSFGYNSFGVRAKTSFNNVNITLGASQSDVDDINAKDLYKDASNNQIESRYRDQWEKKSAILKLNFGNFNFEYLYGSLSYYDQPIFELSNNYGPRALSLEPNHFNLIKISHEASFEDVNLKTIVHAKEFDAHFSSTTVGTELPDSGDTASVNKGRENGFGIDSLISSKSKNWFFGLEYSGAEVPYRKGSLGAIGKELSSIEGEAAKRYQVSAKGNYRFDFMSKQLAFHIGGRWDSYSDDDAHLSPRAALIYKKSKNMTYKLIYSHAYRVPDLGVRYGSTPFFVLPNDNLKPEKLESVELISLYKRDKFRGFISLYHNELKDEIVTAGQTPPYSKAVNLGDGKGAGVEVELRQSYKKLVYDFNANYSLTRDNLTFPKFITKWSVGRDFGSSFVSLYGKHYFNYASSANPNPSSKFSPRYGSNYLNLGLHADYSFKWAKSSHLLSLDIKNFLNRENVAPFNSSSQNGLIEEGTGFFASYKINL